MRTRRPGVRLMRASKFALAWARVHAVGAQDGEVALGIARRRGGQRDVARLARACGWDRHDDIGEIEPASARPAEHDARRLNDGRARRRNQQVDLAGVRRARPDDKGAIGPAGAAGGDRREPDDADDAGAGPRAAASPEARASDAQARPNPMTRTLFVSRASGRSAALQQGRTRSGAERMPVFAGSAAS